MFLSFISWSLQAIWWAVWYSCDCLFSISLSLSLFISLSLSSFFSLSIFISFSLSLSLSHSPFLTAFNDYFPLLGVWQAVISEWVIMAFKGHPSPRRCSSEHCDDSYGSSRWVISDLISYYITIMSYYDVSYWITSYHVISMHKMLHHVMSCHVMSCHVMSSWIYYYCLCIFLLMIYSLFQYCNPSSKF